jgi:DNA-binding response OmpR family regulator
MALKLLLVEDDADVRGVLREALRGAGHDVTEIEDFAAAERAIATGDYDLLITDVRLPGGSGATLAQRARALGGGAILITGYADVQETLERSKIPHLSKPFRLTELFAAIEAIFPPGKGVGDERE